MLTLKEFRKAVRGLPENTPIVVQCWADDPEDFDGVPDGVSIYRSTTPPTIALQCNSETEDD